MKTYTKPRLVALSLSANDMLCGTCSPVFAEGWMNGVMGDVMEDFELFSSIESCTIDYADFGGLEGYCKTTPSADMKAFLS